MYEVLRALISGKVWAIDPGYAETIRPHLEAYLKGEQTVFSSEDDSLSRRKQEDERAAFAARGILLLDGLPTSMISGHDTKSVALIRVSGPILKNDNCGSVGTSTLRAGIEAAAENDNIVGIVLLIDSPGGSVSGTAALGETISNFQKPSACVLQDLAASAAYWIGCSADRVFIENDTTAVGSIGVMVQAYDYSKGLNEAGIQLRTAYSTKSGNKNKPFAEFLEGKNKLIQAESLDPLAQSFHDHVRKHRPHASDESLTGKVYLGKEAIREGLGDEMGGLDAALEYIAQQSKENRKMFGRKKAEEKAAAAAAQNEAPAAENAELTQTEQTDAAGIFAAVQELTAAVTKQKETIASLSERVSAMSTEIAALNSLPAEDATIAAPAKTAEGSSSTSREESFSEKHFAAFKK